MVQICIIKKKSPKTDLREHARYERVLVFSLLFCVTLSLFFQCIEGDWPQRILRLSSVIGVTDQVRPGFTSLKIVSSVFTQYLLPNVFAIEVY